MSTETLEKAPIRVPYGQSVHGEEEIAAVNEVLRTSTQMGKNVSEFQQRVAALFAKKHGIMVNSGSSANYLCIELLGLPQGSEVITPTVTFSTTVAPIVKNGLVPVFIDVEEGTYNLDATQVESMISEKTKAMMIPNLIGNLPNWALLRELANKYNLILIEDSCDTLGATLNGNPISELTDISITSFYGSHIINCAGNGGMLCVNDDAMAEKALLLRSWGRSSSIFQESSEKIENRFDVEIDGMQYDRKFLFTHLGYNIEPSEMGAAFGLVQLKNLQRNIEIREVHYANHMKFFSQYEHWFILPKQLPNTRTAWLAFPLTLRDEAPFTRAEMQIFLEKLNIQTRTVFTGNILRQPGFKNIPRRESDAGYPAADGVTKGGLLLGCHHGLNNQQIQHIHDSFNAFAKHY